MKTIIVFLFAFLSVVTADNFISEFKTYEDAQTCLSINKKYINKISDEVQRPNEKVILLKLKNKCTSSISEEFNAVCSNVEFSKCI
jgi:hypothetical protein